MQPSSPPWARFGSLLVALAMPAGAASAATAWFSNQTAASGLISIHEPLFETGAYCCFQIAGGVVGDFDNDGWQDVFHPTGGGTPDRLFLNNRDGTFTDRAVEWGIAVAHRGTGAAVGDYDGDGWLDLYVTSLGPAEANQPGFHRLYHNRRGRGFVEVAAAMGVNFTSPTIADGFSAAWGDYDLDGDLDLAVAGWISPQDGNRLFRNDGDRFTDATASAGLDALVGVYGFAPRFVDMDGDRDPELIWIGDFRTSRYFVNDGNGRFTDFTAGSGTSLGGNEMGATVADLDGDARFDFYVTTNSENRLYLNQGGNVFVDVGEEAGVRDTLMGWATAAIDADHDSRLDLVVTSANDRQFAFLNTTPPNGALQYREATEELGIDTTVSGRGLAAVDYDNDGDLDLLFFPHKAAIQLYRNDLAGPDGNALRVFLRSGCAPGVAPGGIGSLVKARIGERWLIGRVDGGSNYLSQNELSAHFGLGAAARVDELRVEWTNGQVTALSGVPANQALTVVAAPQCGYCESTPNSTGEAAVIGATGSGSFADNDLVLHATGLPPFTRAVLWMSPHEGFEPEFMGTEGNLCLGEPVERVTPTPVDAGPAGEIDLRLDLRRLPGVRRGEVWRFQFWFEDANPQRTLNSTDGVAVVFH